MASVTHPNDGQTAIDGERSTALKRLSSIFVRLLAEAEWRTLIILASLALCHGLLYLAIVPPWQHYDEPGHFEYALQIARNNVMPLRGEYDRSINQEIADSMYRFRFWQSGERPDLVGAFPPPLGSDQHVHPPLYYSLVALPLRFLQGTTIEIQLLAGRMVSVLLYTLTIIAAWRLAVIISTDEPLVQLGLPLLVAFVPSYCDLMSAVNSDVLVNSSITFMLVGCVLLIRDGLRPTALALAALGLLVALLAKRTAVVAVLPFCLSVLWSVRREPLRWWFWAIGAGLLAAFAAIALRLDLSGEMVVVRARSWFVALDTSYLRLSIDSWLVSVSDWQRSMPLYQRAMERLFAGYWIWFSWGQIDAEAFWIWLFRILVPLCGIGLIRCALVYRASAVLWQQRVIWAFFTIVLGATIAALLRIHPLSPDGQVGFLTSGRYVFFVMIPLIWMLALGWQNLMPTSWRPYSLPALVVLFIVFDASIWAFTMPRFYYQQVGL